MIANTGKLAGRTVFVTGASRGIGKAIALKAARDGANVVIAAKTADPHPKLPGTVHTACAEVEAAGGRCLPCVVDVRDEAQVKRAVDAAVARFGGIDVLVNNASAIHLTGTEETDMKRFDLMHAVNVRGTFLCSKLCAPHLRRSPHPHVLNISPPLNMNPFWFRNHAAYTTAKYGMSMCVLGMAEEWRADGVNVNALWPRTAIRTAAMDMLVGAEAAAAQSREPEVVADAAYLILCKDKGAYTGHFAVDEDVLRREGGLSDADLERYACVPGSRLLPDFFLDEAMEEILKGAASASAGGGHLAEVAGKETRKAEETGTGGGGPPETVTQVFDRIKVVASDEMIAKMKASYEFELGGDAESGGKWFLNLKDAAAERCGRGPGPVASDVQFAMKAADFVKMFAGGLKPTTAFMMGKLKIKGDMGKAMKLEKLMKTMESKL